MPKDPVDAAAGSRIRALRLAARLTPKELAEQLGIFEDKLHEQAANCRSLGNRSIVGRPTGDDGAMATPQVAIALVPPAIYRRRSLTSLSSLGWAW